MARGPFKLQTLGVLRERGVPVQTVLDVGVLGATPELIRTWPDRLHYLFEPVAEFAPMIAQNYRGVPYKLIQAAVSDEAGDTHLKVLRSFGGEHISHSFMTDEAAAETRVVAKVTLDDYLRADPAPGPYFLKVDVDGEELRVLKGAAETLKACSIVMVEATAGSLTQRINAVAAAGFQLFDLTEPAYYDNALWQCDAVFIRADLFPQHFEPLTEKLDPRRYEVFGS